MSFRQIVQGLIESRKTTLVVGLGISGVETARFLLRLGLRARCVERTPEAEYLARGKFREQLEELRKLGAEIHFGVDGEAVGAHLTDVALGIVSPGVSLESAIVGTLKRHGLKIISELELGVELRGIPSAVVTGSNGKSTTVTLLHEVLKRAGFHATLCGNIGTPVVSDISRATVESDGPAPERSWLVVEASSYQLEACQVLKPKIGVFLNLSDNHLERHGSMERYFAAKAQLFAFQEQDDLAVLNADDTFAGRLIQSVRARVATFGVQPAPARSEMHAQIFFDPTAGRDEIRITGFGAPEVLSVAGTRLLGLHNRYNVAAAALASRAAGIPLAVIAEVVTVFTPLEHRIERLLGTGEAGRPIVINDSKATTVAATVAAVRCIQESYPGHTLRLLIGGLAKAGSWEPLMRTLAQRGSPLAPVICFGKDGPLLASHCSERGLPVSIAPSVQSAVTQALQGADEGTVVLFSPGCASFDEFSDFEARGARFRDFVQSSFGGQVRAAL